MNDITKNDLAASATSRSYRHKREFEDIGAEVNLIKPVVEKRSVKDKLPERPRLQYEWLDGEREELVASLSEYIKSQTVG